MKKISFFCILYVLMVFTASAQTVYQTYIVTGNETWSVTNHPQGVWIQQLLKIENGAALTINGIEVRFSQQAEIVVEVGGILTANTALLAPHQSFNFWKGITVKGDPTASQHPLPGNPNTQGSLFLNDNTAIHKAILNKAEGGAIIKATESYFFNNNVSFRFEHYEGFYPVSGNPFAHNVSYFRECHFEVNNDYPHIGAFEKHILLAGVNGVNFRGCHFTNIMTGQGNKGTGIYAWDAGFSVRPGCGTSNVMPCPDPIKSYFIGFENGIFAYTWFSSPRIFIDNAIFTNNGYGIHLEGIDQVTVINSEFNIGQSLKGQEQCNTAFGVGIYLYHCIYYTIENNTLSGAYSGNPNALENYIGVWVHNNHYEFSNVQDNEIYRNNLSHLTDGNLAIGKHMYAKDGYWTGGLQYKCNNNSSNKYDFRTGNTADVGIWLDQGSLNRAAGNSFSKNIVPLGSDFANFASHHSFSLWYFYWPDPNDPSQFPENVINVLPWPANNPHPCTDNFGSGGGQIGLNGLTQTQKAHFEQILDQNQSTFNNVYSLYASLKDAGNTEALVTEVEMAWPQDMWELRAQLLNISPHLSKDALMAAADKTDVLPPSVLFEILSANPDELRNDDLLQYLEDKENPLPQYMMDILYQLTGNITYKTILKSQLNHSSSLKNHAYKVLLQDMMHDTAVSQADIRAFLASKQSLVTDIMVIESYLKEGNTADALALATMLPVLYNLEGWTLDEFNLYLQMLQLQALLVDEGRGVYELTAGELAQIEMLAAASHGRTATRARGLLRFLNGISFTCCPPAPEEGLKSTVKPKQPIMNLGFSPQIEAAPNPASTFVNFSYELPEGQTSGVIYISDAKGQHIETININNGMGQELWDVRSLTNGLYYYTLRSGQSSKSGKIVIGK